MPHHAQERLHLLHVERQPQSQLNESGQTPASITDANLVNESVAYLAARFETDAFDDAQETLTIGRIRQCAAHG